MNAGAVNPTDAEPEAEVAAVPIVGTPATVTGVTELEAVEATEVGGVAALVAVTVNV